MAKKVQGPYTVIKVQQSTRNRIKAIAAEHQWFLEDTIDTALNDWADLVDRGVIGGSLQEEINPS